MNTTPIQLAIFDLDHTLLSNDSDYLWGEYLVENGLVDEKTYRDQHRQFYADYQAACLDIDAYLKFALQPLAQHDMATLQTWHDDFMQRKILPVITPAGQEQIQWHKDQEHFVIIITATNGFIVQPIGDYLQVDDILAVQPEMINGRYTGDYLDKPCYQDGKIHYLRHWLQTNRLDAQETWFYSDSINDLPLLQQVDHPVVVDGDDRLIAEAKRQGWPSISFR